MSSGSVTVTPVGERLAYLDRLKVLLTAGVIVSHAAMTYGAAGTWTYEEDSLSELTAAIAAIGKVWCRATATSSAIEVGDLLTTSTIPGHAMVARDSNRAFGAVVGKALTSLPSGQGLVLTLVTLG